MSTCTSGSICDTSASISYHQLHLSWGLQEQHYMSACMSGSVCDTSMSTNCHQLHLSWGLQEQHYMSTCMSGSRCDTSMLINYHQLHLSWGLQEQQVKRDRAAQIADHRRVTNAVDRCPLCFSSTARPRHLTISLGQTAYLALPAR